ncbi:MAG: carbohydrate ABC transporter permease [Oscillospiraceae bacterium]|nr:carbohydrate ABC transporter permease [Oscillospiraceae bacterium]MCL2278705.1 carbohydrate ABC transporter permease [Oscillospiraceae bacterium]
MRVILRVGMYVFLSIAAFLSIFPLFWTAVSATNSTPDILAASMLPGTHLIANFERLLELSDLGRAFWNSTRNAVILTAVSVTICSLAGYAFEVFHSKAKDRLMGILLLSMMIPFAAVMIPLFRLATSLNLNDTTLGFMLPTLSTAFLIMLFRQSTRSFPHEMIEAARIDGLNELSIFFRIYVPTMKSTYAAAITITFMAAWNVFLWPRLIMMSPEAVTMPMLISNLMAGYVTEFGVVMLAVLIATLPTIIIFLFLQRYFAEGLLGTIK